MIDRITKNEERLDSILLSIKELGESLDSFNNNRKNLKLLNKYYGSNDWFNDREDYDNNKIPKIKAGVLSEDAIWNMNEEINYLIDEMKSIIEYFDKEKKWGLVKN